MNIKFHVIVYTDHDACSPRISFAQQSVTRKTIWQLSFVCIFELQSELPRPIPWNQMYIEDLPFDKVTLTLHNVILTSQKPC